MKKLQKKGAKNLKKGRLVLALLFLIWTILSGMFIAKIAEPTVKLLIVKDNYNFAMESEGPGIIDERNDSFYTYNDYINTLINGNDRVVSFYAQQSGSIKLLLIMFATLPFIMIIWFFVNTYNQDKISKKKQIMKMHSQTYIKKTARV